MAKGHKLRLSFLNSIQICRPKDPSSLVRSPLRALTYMSKTYDISLPSFPDPPPSPPDQFLSTKCNIGSSNINPLGCACRSKSCIMHEMTSGLNDRFSSQAHTRARKEDREKLYTSPFSIDSNEIARPIAPSRIKKKNERTTTKKPKSDSNTIISLADNGKRSSNGFSNPLRTVTEEESKKPGKQASRKTQRFKRFSSKDWKDETMIMTEPEDESCKQKPVSADRKVSHSFVVVKRSVDPCEDFKKSMLEMILEKQMFEPIELEQLLMSFLSLNSRQHHRAILKAFTEIWKEVFSASSS